MTKLIKEILFKIYKTVFILLGLILPKKDNLIVFESFLGRQFSDNPRAIYEYLKENYPECNMYWSVDRRSLNKFNNLDVQYTRRFSLKWMFVMNRAKYWVMNSRMPLWIPKPKNTIYVQTWHGTPLKKLALDMEEVHMPGTNTEKYKRNFVRDSSKWDYLISPNNYSTKIFKRAFNFEKTIIESGYPRNDFLITNNNKDEILKIKERLNLPLDKKIILYAPTWRDNQFYDRGRYKFDIHMDLDLMSEKLSDEYIILMRMHYLVAENLAISEYNDFAYDLSQHEDIRELYLISDLLITDYSSVFFDYAILERPIIFYVYDIDEYRDTLRGFYFDFEKEAPGQLVKTTEELLVAIENIGKDDIINERISKFRKHFCYLEDGNATERVVKTIISNNQKQ